MMTPQSKVDRWYSLQCALQDADTRNEGVIADSTSRVSLSELATNSCLYNRVGQLAGMSVLLFTHSQFTTASALIELDGIARRLVLCPPGLSVDGLSHVIKTAEIDAVISDYPVASFASSRPIIFCPCSRDLVPATCGRGPLHPTEWVLLTSGTTGLPKLVAHTLSSLTGAIQPNTRSESAKPVIWATFYDIRRYGGLQIFLRSILNRSSLVLSDPREPVTAFLARAASSGVTHISGTPSHWRNALMSSATAQISPEYVRLSGEIADPAILAHLRRCYPNARIVHAFASTEAGVAFEVTDGLAGFPSSVIDNTPGVAMTVTSGSLRIRSARNAARYLGDTAPPLKDASGFVDSNDMLELRDDRYYFVGRRDGVINVGGLKVHPEGVEAVINRHPAVEASLVRVKKSPLLGGLIVADVVLDRTLSFGENGKDALQGEIMRLCRNSLSPHEVPAAITFLPSLGMAASGKVLRNNA